MAFAAFVVCSALWSCKGKHKTINELAYEARRRQIVDDFPKIPHDEMLQQIGGGRVYNELVERYRNSLIALKTETDYDCAKLLVVIVSAEVGKNSSVPNTYGIPLIVKSCDNIGIDFYDLSTQLAAKDMSQIAMFPEEGIWTKEGAEYIANLLGDIIMMYDAQKSSKYPATKAKPATFGDLPPNQNEVLDEEKSTQYRLKVNSQGLRMDYDIRFPKKKQRVLILGDGKVMNPYIDNPYIATTLLQKRFPDKEIINAGVTNYTMDDFESLYREKARFVEPDVVIVCTDGGDILDNYFSQRNRYSRSRKIYMPSQAEEDFYEKIYSNK